MASAHHFAARARAARRESPAVHRPQPADVRWLRVVVLVWRTANGKRHHAILATTDLNATAADILRIYQARFQIEFLLRDGKQHAGLTECQARNKQALDCHFNASLG